MNTGKYWAMESLSTFFTKHTEMWLLQKLNENTTLLPMDLSHSLGKTNFLFTENKWFYYYYFGHNSLKYAPK